MDNELKLRLLEEKLLAALRVGPGDFGQAMLDDHKGIRFSINQCDLGQMRINSSLCGDRIPSKALKAANFTYVEGENDGPAYWQIAVTQAELIGVLEKIAEKEKASLSRHSDKSPNLLPYDLWRQVKKTPST